MTKKQVILLGKGTLAVRIADWFLKSKRYDLINIVPVVPEPTWTDSLTDWARRNGIHCVESGDYHDLKINPNSRPDLVFSVFYDKIIKEWFISMCKKIVNLHNGPLPKYRGVSPINWALKNGEIEHGVTIHEITTGIDDGPILAQIKYSIYPDFDEVISVYNRALEYGLVLFEQTMSILDKITPRPQDNSIATYYGRNENNLLGERRGFTKRESQIVDKRSNDLP